MFFIVILVVLLIGNWLLSEAFVFIPLDLVTRLISLSWWGIALGIIIFLAWCIADD